jgi:hypothetical protein
VREHQRDEGDTGGQRCTELPAPCLPHSRATGSGWCGGRSQHDDVGRRARDQLVHVRALRTVQCCDLAIDGGGLQEVLYVQSGLAQPRRELLVLARPSGLQGFHPFRCALRQQLVDLSLDLHGVSRRLP